MKVFCQFDETTLQGDESDDVPGICVTCSRCQHEVEVFGQTDRSVNRGLMMLREECPRNERNFYVGGEPDGMEQQPVIQAAPIGAVQSVKKWDGDAAVSHMAEVQRLLDAQRLKDFPALMKSAAKSVVDAFAARNLEGVRESCRKLVEMLKAKGEK